MILLFQIILKKRMTPKDLGRLLVSTITNVMHINAKNPLIACPDVFHLGLLQDEYGKILMYYIES